MRLMEKSLMEVGYQVLNVFGRSGIYGSNIYLGEYHLWKIFLRKTAISHHTRDTYNYRRDVNDNFIIY